jgi:plasmid stability protein
MAGVLIRNLDEQTVDLLKKRATRNGRSLQAELREIIERAAKIDVVDGRALAAQIRRELSGRPHSDSAELIAEDRRR